MAVTRWIGAALSRQQSLIAGAAERRHERCPAQVVTGDELRHGLEHRQLDGLALAGACLVEQSAQQRVGQVKADRAVADVDRRIARRAVDALEQRGHAGGRLHDVVVGRTPGIRAALAEAEGAADDQAQRGDAGADLAIAADHASCAAARLGNAVATGGHECGRRDRDADLLRAVQLVKSHAGPSPRRGNQLPRRPGNTARKRLKAKCLFSTN